MGTVNIVVVLGLACLGWVSGGSRYSKNSSAPGKYDKMEDLLKANIAFTWDMLRAASSTQNSGNVFVSPYSISMAAAMLAIGARGETKVEVEKAFHWSNIESILESLSSVNDELTRSESAKFDLASRIFVDSSINLLSSYNEVIEKFFKAEVGKESFAADAASATDRINGWVSEHTHGKIKDLFPSGSLDSSTRLALANAVYFKGRWKSPFDGRYTRDHEFRLESGKTAICQMMFASLKPALHYDEKLHISVVMLPYEGEEYQFVAALPRDSSVNLSELQSKMSRETLQNWLDNLTQQQGRVHDEVEVFLPRFKIEFKLDLIELMQKKFGIRHLFEDSADLSGLSGARNLKCGKAFHKAFVEVNEEGTEAAAATGMGIVMYSMPLQLIFDRPFWFFIVSSRSGAVVFAGKMSDPSA